MVTICPLTVLTVYSVQSQPTPYHTIPVGMYLYFLSNPPVPITSPVANLNLALISFYPPDAALVLTSDNLICHISGWELIVEKYKVIFFI